MKNWLYLIVLLIVGCQGDTYLDDVELIMEEDPCDCACVSFPEDGLVAYYPFNGNTLDESGNENHPLYDTSILTEDRNGEVDKSVYFSGEKQQNYIQLDIDTESITTNASYSISFWVYREGEGSNLPRVLEFWANDGPGQLGFTWGNNGSVNMGMIYDNVEVNVVEVPVNSNNWHHITWTVDIENTMLYVNGEKVNSIDSKGIPSLSNEVAFGMMNHPSWDSFNGKLDDIGIWNRVLNEDEITYLFEN